MAAGYYFSTEEKKNMLEPSRIVEGIQPDARTRSRQPSILLHLYRQPPRSRKPSIFVLPSLPQGITLQELSIMKLTAQFVAVYGVNFRLDLKESLSKNPLLYASHLQFLDHTRNRRRNIAFERLVSNYTSVFLDSQILSNRSKSGASSAILLEGFFNILRQVLEKDKQEGVDMAAMIELRAAEFFSKMEPPLGSQNIQRDEVSSTQGREPTMLVLPQGFTVKKLNAFKLTAQFVGFFGKDLMDSLFEEKEFLPFTCVGRFFVDLYSMYGKVLKSPWDFHFYPIMENVREAYSKLLHQVLEKEEEEEVGVETAMSEMHALEFFGSMEWMGWSKSLRSPVPERQSIDDSVPNFERGKTIEIPVFSFSESVASLKERIAAKIQIPANKQKLLGDFTVLEDNKSLQQNLVRAGDMLTVCY